MSSLHGSHLIDNDWLQKLSSLTIDDMVAVVYLLDFRPDIDLFVVQALENSETRAEAEGLFGQHVLQVQSTRHNFFGLLFEILKLIQNQRVERLLFSNWNKTQPAGLISTVKKHLYVLADKLDERQTCELISRVEKTPINECRYFEEFLLRWQTEGIINIGPDWDSTLLGSIENYAPPCWQKSKHQSTHSGTKENLQVYPIIDPTQLGLCIVFNNSEFTRNDEMPNLMPESALQSRPGSDKDVETVTETFQSFNFQVHHHENVQYSKLKLLLEQYADSVSPSHSALVFIFMSHGMEGIVYTSDSVPIKVDSLEMAFQRDRCPILTGKPKIFIVQACQGVDLQSIMVDGPDEMNCSKQVDGCHGPERADAVIAWSTVKGYASFRDKFEGAWFIQELCRELHASAHSKDFVEIVTNVNSNLRNKSYHGLTMVPSLTSSLCKKIKFLSSISMVHPI